MKIAMFTNTYLPHVGGVARSVKTLEDALRALGHEVRVVAPEFDGAEESPEVLRVPAIQHFNGSDFSVRLPFPNLVRDFMEDFQPDLIHSHHPFLLGDSALRESWKMQVPIVFTHHTLYERYTHYVPFDSPALRRMAIRLATEYCNLCDHVIAPSASIAELLVEREVITPVTAIPTGIDLAAFAGGDGARFREIAGIPPEARVIGHVGRLAAEKNLLFLAEAVGPCLAEDPGLVFLIVGDGDARAEMVEILSRQARPEQIRDVGKQSGRDLAGAYRAMDWFVFASQSETQGMVLAEAMAAGKPVVALDGPGVREILHDGREGLLLPADATAEDFSTALRRIIQDPDLTEHCALAARETVKDYGTDHCVDQVLACYRQLVTQNRKQIAEEEAMPWDRLIAGIEVEWDLIAAKVSAAAAGVSVAVGVVEEEER